MGKQPHERKKAVALRYREESESAPRVVAKGTGKLAERIIQTARENNVFIQEDPDLVGLLAQLDVNTDIPEDLYLAVAEVLAFIYGLNQELPGRHTD
ncbi:MAG: hypothetical protein COA73_02730 [Candidatus Hydrogenedentota bacterium]|nr:MAG: hypothetical protein COA73_02730 [Candidatus Hydrogenedentota bacterium]